MKPTRNKLFCYGCRRQKMLFETQSKADNFIRYNSDGILEETGKAPVRSYYCEICGGYPVTSNPSAEVGERLNQRDRQLIDKVTAYKKDIEEVKALTAALSKRLVHIKALLFFGKVNEAEDLLDICKFDIGEIGSHNLKGSGKLTTLRGRVEKMYELMESVKGVLSLSEEEQLDYISKPHLDKDETSLAIILSNARVIEEIDALLKDNETSLADGKKDGVLEKLDKCRELLATVQRAGKKEVISKYNTLFDEQQQRLKKLGSGEKKPTHHPTGEEKSVKDKEKKSNHIDKQEYKAAILSMIERLETIQESFNVGDYDTCETEIEIVYYMLDELQVEDNNTTIIEQQLAQWAERLKNV